MSLPVNCVPLGVEQEWGDESVSAAIGDARLEVDYAHIAHLVQVPSLMVGSLTLAANPTLPSFLYSLLSQKPPDLKRQQLLLADVKNWLGVSLRPTSTTSLPFVILGKNKSVVSASLISQLLLSDVLVGAVHFCRKDDDASNASFFSLLSSLAAQLAAHVKGFGAAVSPSLVVAAIESGDFDVLFESLVAAPLRAALASSSVGRPVVIVVDSLEDLQPDVRAPMLDLLEKRFASLVPARVKLIVTAASDQVDVAVTLGKFKPWQVDETMHPSSNLVSLRKDLEYLSDHLADFSPEELAHVSAVSNIVAKVKSLREYQMMESSSFSELSLSSPTYRYDSPSPSSPPPPPPPTSSFRLSPSVTLSSLDVASPRSQLTKAYLEGTRLWVFHKVETWVSQPSPSSPLFVLFGVGGTGMYSVERLNPSD